jgi:AcrR family transcriptional regulator
MKTDQVNKRALDYAKTKKKILQAAFSLFVKHGFNGVSISEIAKKAKINQSLIYHYFDSKDALWKGVKQYFVETYFDEKELEVDPSKGVEHVLRQIVHHRFSFYSKHPEIIRMMRWQKLEPEKKRLAGGSQLSPYHWKDVFLNLQAAGEIRSDVDIDLMVPFVANAISETLCEAYEDKLFNLDKQSHYLEMVVQCLIRCFKG